MLQRPQLLHLVRNASLVLSRQPQVPICRRILLANTLRSVLLNHVSYPARSLSTTAPRLAALAEQLSAKSTVVLQTPSPEYIEQEELDVELLPSEEVKLVITDRAAEVREFILVLGLKMLMNTQQLRSIAARGNGPSAALRISVESGGCHGYQYKMELAQETKLDD